MNLQFQPALPILPETPQNVQQALPDTQLQREMDLDDSGEDFTDSDAEIDIKDAQNLPTSVPRSRASSRHEPATQETQEEGTQVEMEEPEPKWDRTWDVLNFWPIM